MTKPIINSHEDLMVEKARLKANLKQHKQNMKQSFGAIKDELSPVTSIARTTRNIFNADTHNPLIGMGIAKITDLVIRKGLLRKAGWLSRLIAPLLIRKVSTYLVAEKGGDKIADLLHTAADKIRDDALVKYSVANMDVKRLKKKATLKN